MVDEEKMVAEEGKLELKRMWTLREAASFLLFFIDGHRNPFAPATQPIYASIICHKPHRFCSLTTGKQLSTHGRPLS